VRPLRVGVQLPEVERAVRWPEYVAMARAAEEVGFDSIWVGDHLLYRDDGRPERGPWDAWTLGIPFDNRVARFAEAFEIIRRLLAGERVSFAGDYETVNDAVLLPEPARRPSLMVGATGPRMLVEGSQR
jgi:alkanesulfonate monooxygenase SsuD/methylene tetrahydromethanopterin reductase-like flavin-dependent oxidoreductase (luciferase family)